MVSSILLVIIELLNSTISRPIIAEDEARQLVAKLSAVQIPAEAGGSTRSLWKSPISIVGLNASLRALHKGTVDVLIISASIRPKHIVDQCIMLALGQNEGIRILCVPKLNDLLADTLGFGSCLCFSLRGDLARPSLQEVLEFVNTLSVRFSTPSSYVRPVHIAAKPPRDFRLTQNPKKPLSPVPFDSIYVAKPTAGRSFVPAGTVLQTTTQNDWSEFISFSGAEKTQLKQKDRKPIKNPVKHQEDVNKAKHKKTNYITLAVNRVQPNPNKVKKPKIQKNKC